MGTIQGGRSLRPGRSFALEEKFVALYLTTIYHRQSPSSFQVTPYGGLEAIPPGHGLSVHRHHSEVVDYYAKAGFPEEEDLSDQDCIKKLLSLFNNAVEKRIQNADNVCVSLSGGLDSSGIIGTIAESKRIVRPKVTAITFYHAGMADFDERSWARLVAQKAHVPMVEIRIDDRWILKPSQEEMELPDEPTINVLFMDLNQHLNKTYRQHGFDVCLTGHGGDQLFRGHPSYLYDVLRRRHLRQFIVDFPRTCMRKNRSFFEGFKDYCVEPAHPPIKYIFEDWLGAKLRGDGVREMLSTTWSLSDKVHSFSQRIDCEAVYREVRNFERVRRPIEMEFRRPYFDRRLVEFALSLNPLRKMRGDRVRVIQREAWKEILPREVCERKDKGGTHEVNVMGFRREWEFVQNVYSKSPLVEGGYADAKEYKDGLEMAKEGSPSAYRTAMQFLSLDIWLMGKLAGIKLGSVV